MDSLAEHWPARNGAARAVRKVGSLARPAATFVLGAVVLVPAHVVVIGGILWLGIEVADRALPGGSILQGAGRATAGALVLGVALVSGTFAGVAAAGRRALDRLEAVLAHALQAMDGDTGARAISPLPISSVRAGYEALLDRMAAEMFARVPAPAFLTRLARRGLRQAPVEDFLAYFETRGIEQVGLPEVRNWSVAQGIPLAFAPARAQLRALRAAGLGIAAAAAAGGLLVAFVFRSPPA